MVLFIEPVSSARLIVRVGLHYTLFRAKNVFCRADARAKPFSASNLNPPGAPLRRGRVIYCRAFAWPPDKAARRVRLLP